ncbi:MAG: hypothetical protein M3Y79_05035, partial [Pseudomonadota bacterium]|nr:hypothetical protein [Pseudomonadota bacterium]
MNIRIRSGWRTTLLVVGTLLAGCGPASETAHNASGAAAADSARYQRSAWYVPMEDGVRLAVTLY